ncbi:MAG: ABC transporter substrate-binding protein [Methanothrix sp.]|uniref:ABC transporter substrate-binding protein n=1 Tax=Methanothrix sp. TaxID=90426 RepID=UPI00247DFEA1|nr:ABC transporter substrate-binding protein [Methanothrix sp.]
MYRSIALMALLAVLTGIPALAFDNIPGDLNGDRVVSDDELKIAEESYAKGEISSDSLSEIRHIHERYPMSVVDSAGRNVTLYRPVRSIACTVSHQLETLRSIGVTRDLVVAAPSDIEKYSLFQEYHDLPEIGHFYEPDLEKIIQIHPDLLLVHPGPGPTGQNYLQTVLDRLNNTGITIFCLACSRPDSYPEEIEKLGRLLERENESARFRAFYEGVLGSVIGRTKGIPEENRPKVYVEYGPYRVSNNPILDAMPVEMAGGKSIVTGTTGGEISPETVIAANPDVIIRLVYDEDYDGRDASDISKLKSTRDEIMGRPELQNVTAVRNGRVFVMASPFWTYLPYSGCRHFIGLAYLAKILHPDVFADMDPRAVHQTYLSEFQHLDYDLSRRGALIYPEP